MTRTFTLEKMPLSNIWRVRVMDGQFLNDEASYYTNYKHDAIKAMKEMKAVHEQNSKWNSNK